MNHIPDDPTMSLRLMVIYACLLTIGWGTEISAIQPARWIHTTEADFATGELDHTVVTNLGDLKLAPQVKTIGRVPREATVIYDLQTVDGEIYLAAGPEAKLLRRQNDSFETVFTLASEQIFALDVYQGQLLMAISGSTSRLAVLDGDNTKILIELEGIRYIWDVIVDNQIIYVATGTDGKLLRIDLSHPASADQGHRDPRVKVLLDTVQKNLLCLGRDTQGHIYTGTDIDGLVYRLNPDQDADPHVLYDAAEPEIAALLVLDNGTVYAGTADADQAKHGRLKGEARKEIGRPHRPKDQNNENRQEQNNTPSASPAPLKASNTPDIKGTFHTTPTNDLANESHALRKQKPNHKTQNIPADNGTPSTEQYNELRQVTDAWLTEARKTAKSDQPPQATPESQASKPTRSSSSTTSKKQNKRPQTRRKPGNAIYRIGTDHFVSEIFRESVMVLKILEDRGRLIVATGNEGQIFHLDPDAEETTILTELNARQVPAIFAEGDRLLAATANPAMVVELHRGFSGRGQYTSQVLDANHVSQWGTMHVTAKIPTDTSMAVEVRSGNVEDPERATWFHWSPVITLNHDPQVPPSTPQRVRIDAPHARFFQYRLGLNGHEHASPVVDRIQITYVLPNLKPRITEFQARYPGKQPGGTAQSKGKPKANATISKHESDLNLIWKAADDNGDQLIFTIECQPAGSDKWVLIAEDLSTSTYKWNTNRMPDGRYILKVNASDSKDNGPNLARTATRLSDPILIDNTPPQWIDPKPIQIEDNHVTVKVSVRDALSPIKEVHWAVDSHDDWQLVSPTDLIYDSTAEDIIITIPDLMPGAHVITIRAVDLVNNALYKAQFVRID